jgi:hypothetical protein
MSFNLLEPLDQREKDGLLQYCKDIIDSGITILHFISTFLKNFTHHVCMYVLYVCIGKVKEQIFVTKNVNLHQQHGISLASAEALFHKYIR